MEVFVKATPLDILASIEVHKAAFGPEEGEVIAKLVEDLHQDDTARPLLSLVASIGDKVVEHVLFTNAWLAPASTAKAVILAPLAVHPDLQRQGVGAKLIADGLKRLREGAVDLVFVLGHPTYYPRHGFQPAGVKDFEATYEIKPENAGAWMVQELQAGALDKFHGDLAGLFLILLAFKLFLTLIKPKRPDSTSKSLPRFCFLAFPCFKAKCNVLHRWTSRNFGRSRWQRPMVLQSAMKDVFPKIGQLEQR